jgi:hypothetical protein
MEREIDDSGKRLTLDRNLDIVNISDVNAGHMMYQKLRIQSANGDLYFVKTSDDSLLTDKTEADKMWQYLIKEQYAYDILDRNGFTHIPKVELDNRSLVMEYLANDQGWYWNAPDKESDKYVSDVLSALGELENLPISEELDQVESLTSTQKLFKRGWQTIDDLKIIKILNRSDDFEIQLKDHIFSGIEYIDTIINDVEFREELIKNTDRYIKLPTNNVGHFDARQANIGWHPVYGVKIIDWSWVSRGPAKSDSTMFLIDLHKSGVDVSEYIDTHFDVNHANLLIGYWLSRCAEPSFNNLDNVRFHQYASAVSAGSLLTKLGS